MCGIFGYFGERPDIELLSAAALAAGSRGPHAHGWWDGEHCYRQLGPIQASASVIPSARRLVGHTRLATTSCRSIARLGDAQPLAIPGGCIAHNGVVYRARELDDRYNLGCETQNDSEALGRLAALAGLDEALRIAEQWSYAVILAVDGEVWAARQRLPLYLLDDDGVYLCSRRLAGSSPLAEGRAVRIA